MQVVSLSFSRGLHLEDENSRSIRAVFFSPGRVWGGAIFATNWAHSRMSYLIQYRELTFEFTLNGNVLRGLQISRGRMISEFRNLE